jgi:hypothetical protein
MLLDDGIGVCWTGWRRRHDRNRVFLTERCGGGTWSEPEIIRSTGAGYDQFIGLGRPNIGLNRQDEIVHVAFVEMDDHDRASFEDGTVWWATRGYTACP